MRLATADFLVKHEASGSYLGAGFVLTERADALVLAGDDARAVVARHAPMPGFVVVPYEDDDADDEAAA